ncbi:hypothetical protein AX16_003737 [Volvariella volvacea WC 439]|nr:hypothetical protein AX16_003737 [Volvariella volvacea WC 439]
MPDTESPQNVPYQAYKSKRHSRTSSNILQELNISPSSPSSRPASLDFSRTPIQSPHLQALSLSDPEPGQSSYVTRQTEPTGNSDTRTPSLSLPQMNGASASPGSARASTSSAPHSTESLVKASTRKATTLRRVAVPKPRLPSSPLGPNRPIQTHSRVTSIPSTPSSPLSLPQPLDTKPPELSLTIPTTSTLLTSSQPPPSAQQPESRGPAFTPIKQPVPLPPDSRPGVVSAVPSPAPQASRSSSSTPNTPSTSLPSSSRSPAPYRPGFQPKGVYRLLSDDFLELRRQKRDGDGRKRVERTKLERRLEKLIALHFPDPTSIESPIKEKPASLNRRASSLFEFDLKNVSVADAGSLWKGMLNAIESNAKVDIRAAEQRIAPWEEDSTASKCPLCASSFHPLTNRKHHCRLCGKIICSLPIKRPQRPESCSTLFVVEPKTRKIEEVGEGVDYGVRRRKVAAPGTNNTSKVEEDEDKFLKGVRICRECRPVLLRQQYFQEMTHIPVFVKLYDVFILLEKEIEDALPKFQELVLSLSHDTAPSKEASAARKRILEAFAQYDALAKQIRALPCPNGAGSSQDRVQLAIMMRARLFLEKNMLPLQSLPSNRNASKQSTPVTQDSEQEDPYTDIAHILQPLLEQEALLESFVEEATAQRKFEDVKSLKSNLKEIRAEIKRLVDAEEDKSHRRGKGGG